MKLILALSSIVISGLTFLNSIPSTQHDKNGSWLVSYQTNDSVVVSRVGQDENVADIVTLVAKSDGKILVIGMP